MATARCRTHLGGSPMETITNRSISPPGTSHWLTRHWSTSHWSTSHPVTSQPGTSQSGTSQPGTSQPVTGQPGTSQPGTGHPDTSQYLPDTSHRSVNMDYQAQSPGTGLFISYQHSPVIQSPVLGLQSSYPASISSHHSRNSECRLPSIDNMGSEHSLAHELPNPSTSSRMILPLESDFSNVRPERNNGTS